MKPDMVMEGTRGVWYNLSQPMTVGLAAPVQKLLDALPYEISNGE
jgi:A/G-specific adenine glycosylase